MKKTILFSITLLLLVTNVFAYPISPRPLRQLVIESQYIIVGYVIKTYENKAKQYHWDTRIARIAVKENLQGQIKMDTIEVMFNPNMICPSPDRYFDSTYVVSFLDENKENGKFYTHALSYGVKTLKKDEIDIYKKRINEIQEILKISDKEKQRIETVEWLVKCAEIETTRWEGTFELSPESDFMSYYSKNEKRGFKDFINDAQKLRLKNALLCSTDWVNFGLVDLVYKGSETEIEDFLFIKLKTLRANEIWLADNFIYRLKHKINPNEAKSISEDFRKFQFENNSKGELLKVIQRFINLLEKKMTPKVSFSSLYYKKSIVQFKFLC